MQIDKTGPDSKSQHDFYKFIKLRCGKVWGPETRGTEKQPDKDKREQSKQKFQCAVQIDKTGPDSKSQHDFYKVIELRCGKVWGQEVRGTEKEPSKDKREKNKIGIDFFNRVDMVDMVDGVDGAHGFDKVDGVEIHILENAI